MSRTRPLAGALVLALTLGLFGVGLAASPASAARSPLIQGVVVDQGGRYVDDVTVQAVDATGEARATSLTYASQWEDGPQHGYFFLEVPAGTYTVRLSRDGYVPATLTSVTVRRRGRVSLGEVTLEKLPAATTTKASLRDAEITTGDKGKVDVSVSVGAGEKAAGRVTVRHGRKILASATLRAADRGRVTLTLGRLARGSYDLRATFAGSALLARSESKKLTLDVTKPRRKRPLPNALPFVG